MNGSKHFINFICSQFLHEYHLDMLLSILSNYTLPNFQCFKQYHYLWWLMYMSKHVTLSLSTDSIEHVMKMKNNYC
jgi:hypothetical protein